MIDFYLARQYPSPPCWHLVADIYTRELGLKLADYTPGSDGNKSVASAFRLALHKGEHGFSKVERPDNFAVVVLGKWEGKSPTHCGVWYEGGVIHALRDVTLWEPIHQIRDRFKSIEYWVRNGNH